MTETDKYIVFSLLNAALLVTVVFNTVNFYLFVAIIFILVMVCSVLIRRKILKTGPSGKKYFYGVTFPMIVNSFFLINYLTGMNLVRETYCFRNMMAEVGSKHSHQKGKTTYIYLNGNAYEYSYMTRSFFIYYKRMLFKNQITYTFERGILGMKIRKDFEYTYNENCMNR